MADCQGSSWRTGMIAQLKADLVEGAEAVFDGKRSDKCDVQRLRAKIKGK